MDLLNLCLTSTYFQYNGKHYKQLHGTAMGSPVSVVVAEIVMQNIEEQALATYTRTVPLSGSARGVSGIPVHPKKIRQNTQKYPKFIQIYPKLCQVYFISEIQRKRYTEYPYLSCNIPYTRFKKPLYTVYPKTLADPALWLR